MTITPDTKNWTWVLERPCPECAFDASVIAPGDVPTLLRTNAEAWRALLAAGIAAGPDGLRTRPEPAKWSPLEYSCHVRDCNEVYFTRVGLMLEQDDPQYPNWDQDETAVAEKYNEQDPEQVLAALVATAEQLAERFAGVSGEQWERTGHRSDGSDFTIATIARYFIHDPIHHYWDVTGQQYAG
ncbi:DinB family protein [Catenulispora yoronensis]|uniref:DinB family protein n=1 Tax=Catenulispora yoronensis TaxID=450799 RepID=A0ABN2U8U9_9ACTN